MAKLTRSKNIWHIPKRGNVHQTIFMVDILTGKKFNGKVWSGQKQESVASEMSKAGVTDDGKALTHQSIRTLLANIPKYLGFVYINESKEIVITQVGYNLVKHHKIHNIKKEKNLKIYRKKNSLIKTSEIFKEQMLKLIITNSVISNDCKDILVFPFRFTLKLLLKLEYLDMEEIGYILFHVKKEDEFPVILQKIKNFRTLTPVNRTKKIDAYKKTQEGILTLVKAPSAGYYMYLCESTGICERIVKTVNKISKNKLTAIKLINEGKHKALLEKFKDAEIYDFKDDEQLLWKEYYTSSRIFPPITASITSKLSEKLLIFIKNKDLKIFGEVSNNKKFYFPAFPNENYNLHVFSYSSSKPILQKKIQFSKTNKRCNLDFTKKIVTTRTKNDVVEEIKEFFSEKYDGFDKNYASKLKLLLKITGKNNFNRYRRGGRLEFLFFDLLSHLKNEGKVDEVFWYGKNNEFDIAGPAPGGIQGNPDITFESGKYLFVVELTTWKGNRSQWAGSEASSVPDHIAKIKKENPSKKVIGIFSAPSIHHQLEKNLTLNAKKEKVGMIFLPCVEFAEFLEKADRTTLKKLMIQRSRKQLSG